MSRSKDKRSKKSGLSPGTLMHVGEEKTGKPQITVIDYDGDAFLENKVPNVEDCFPFKDTATVTWINIDGVHDTGVMEKIGSRFDLHSLILEDIMTTIQRPKMEDLGDLLYIVLRMIDFDGEKREIVTEQVSLVLGSNFVLSFLEDPGDVFDPVRERIRKGKGRIRKMGADYLAYALVDTIVDNYFAVLEKLGENIEAVEEELVADPRKETLHEIHTLKREMISLRKSVWPLREAVSGLLRGDSALVRDGTRIFLRDVYDHTIQVIDNVETYRDMLSGMLETYLSSVSNRMNEVMKVLTVIATIFIPLTFIAGIYGMNFQHMPELKWRYGYFIIWGIMALIAGFMLVQFKKKKWL
ncbi:MAG TPA: magnesium/cobalt transporter CorA [Candidatus Aminicenantes bacterium]|nr:magnesium/cobalt transporter CorA [Candidatus Aminicenantes bacterium]